MEKAKILLFVIDLVKLLTEKIIEKIKEIKTEKE